MTNTMSYKGYTVSMIFDPEDKIIVGRVLDIDDIISFHWNSVAEFSGTSLNKWAERALGTAARRARASAHAESGT